MRKLNKFEKRAIEDYEKERHLNTHRKNLFEHESLYPGRTMATEGWGFLNNYIDRKIKPKGALIKWEMKSVK